MKFEQVELAKIDFNDGLYSIRSLNPTIRQWDGSDLEGNPIWLQEKPEDCYRIVDGFKRLSLDREQKRISPVPSFIFPMEHSLLELWNKRVTKKSIQQDLSAIGLLESLCTLLEYSGKSSPPAEIADTLVKHGIADKNLCLEKIQHLVAIIKQHCQFCDIDRLSYKEMTALSDRSQEDLKTLSSLLSGLKLKGNKLSTILQLFDELAKGYNRSPQKLLLEEEIADIISNSPPHLKYKLLKDRLSQLRWPVLRAHSKKWQHLVNSYRIPGELEISIDPQFESEHIDFHLKASTLEEFRNRLGALLEKAKLDEFAELFDFV